MQPPQQEAFGRVWRRVADAMIDGLADPNYPDDHREDLYDALAGARECLAVSATPRSSSDALRASGLMLAPEIKRRTP
jgi:hypothetical protein